MLRHLDDKTLLVETKEVARLERATTARVLEYLSEVDRRRLWSIEGYASLHDYCVRCLGYSEAEGWRRIQSARCVERVPAVLPLLQNNALSLTNVSLIAPYVTPENAERLLPKVEGKSSRQVDQVLREEFEEARVQPEWFKALLDEELKGLIAEVQKEVSEKNPTELLKKTFKKILSRKTRNRVAPVKHTRYVTAALKREVKAEGGHQCTYRGPSGVGCNQIAHLEVDHVRAWALGGSSRDKGNLRPLCKVHNLLLAKQAFPHWQAPPRDIRRALAERSQETKTKIPFAAKTPWPQTATLARETTNKNARP